MRMQLQVILASADDAADTDDAIMLLMPPSAAPAAHATVAAPGLLPSFLLLLSLLLPQFYNAFSEYKYSCVSLAVYSNVNQIRMIEMFSFELGNIHSNLV